MTLIRHLSIHRFRGIQKLEYYPSPGVNCLIGSGDVGKSTILEAIDLCIGSRKNPGFNDTDFYALDVSQPFEISVTLGQLSDDLKNMEAYGLYFGGIDILGQELFDEPGTGLDTTLTVVLTVGDDLEPTWELLSHRAQAQGLSKSLSWVDRMQIAPTRIGTASHYNLGWRRGSVLNKLSDERANTSISLASAGRDARQAFGESAQDKLPQTLNAVNKTTSELGLKVGKVTAMLDIQSVSFSGGTISLHDNTGVPLSSLGTGSTRLLIAGLQRKAAENSSIILVDELEYGLEPHRITRFLEELGLKETEPPLQVFMTTHSPVAVRELSGNQLFIIRKLKRRHSVTLVGIESDIQSTVRKYAEAFLAKSIVVCEGASEVGLMRGLDNDPHQGFPPITASGAALVDGGGTEMFKRAIAFHNLGYRVCVLRDSDVLPTPELEKRFIEDGNKVFYWQGKRSLEDELFASLDADAVKQLIDYAISLKGEDLINNHIKSASSNNFDLNAISFQYMMEGEYLGEMRIVLGKASRLNGGWFKVLHVMEEAAHRIISPFLSTSDESLAEVLKALFKWVENNDA